MISAVLLSWKRPQWLKQICVGLRAHQMIDELIVWNNNPELHLEIEGAKTINSSTDMGLYTRFAAASLAKNECILFHDDDLSVPHEMLERLYDAWKSRPTSCHGTFGRVFNVRGEYNVMNRYGSVEVVLTRCVLAPRNACIHALLNTPNFVDLQGVPAGNGEDIILSYAAMDISRCPNHAYKTQVTEYGDDDSISISKRYPQHIEHRSHVIRRCRQVFRVSRPAFRIRATHATKRLIDRNVSRVKRRIASVMSD